MTIKKIYLVFLMLALPVVFLEGGWLKTYGGPNSDYGNWVEQTSDNGYIITGSFGLPEMQNRVYLIKTDLSGDTLWSRIYGQGGGNIGSCVQQTSEGGYIIVGEKSIDWLWLLMTDLKGDTLWTKQYSERSAKGYCLRQISDDGYIITGSTLPPPPAGNDILWVLGTNSLGDTLWTRSYPDTSFYVDYSLALSDGGGCVVTGLGKGIPLIKVDSSGNTIWRKTYILGNLETVDIGFSIQETSDKCFIISGVADEGPFFTSGALFLLKTDSSGDSLWAKIYDPTSKWDAGASVHQTPDGGYIVAGTQDYSMQHTGKIWLLKTDSEGDMLWERTFEGNPDARGDCLALCSDGGYAITGFVSVNGSPDIVLIKTDSLGFVGVKESSSPLPPPPPLWEVTSAVGSEVILKYKSLPQGFALTIYDTSGRKVDDIYPQGSSGEMRWGKGQAAGVYIIRERQSSRARVVLIK